MFYHRIMTHGREKLLARSNNVITHIYCMNIHEQCENYRWSSHGDKCCGPSPQTYFVNLSDTIVRQHMA